MMRVGLPAFLMLQTRSAFDPQPSGGAGVGVDNLLLESGDNVLLEDGSVILLE